MCRDERTTAELLERLDGPLSLHAEMLAFEVSAANATIGEGPCPGKIGRNMLGAHRVLLDNTDIDILLLEIPHLSRDLVKRFK